MSAVENDESFYKYENNKQAFQRSKPSNNSAVNLSA